MALKGLKNNKQNNLTKSDLVGLVARNTKQTLVATKDTIDALLEVIVNQTKGGAYITLQNFGTFQVVRRKARTGTNFATGRSMKIAAKNVLKFKVSKSL